MRVSRKTSVRKWTRILASALDDACERLGTTPERYISRLNRQHNSIREWDLGSGASAKPTGGADWRLLK